MMWVDYNIDSIPGGKGFKVSGDWPGEVMGVQKDGTLKDNWLYKPGDVFVVNESGWLIKTDEVNALLMKHESKKNGSSTDNK
tara:strand:+ start:194 stop:439 length:246 start_codon:yes stop_codon:yes gene_type:complete